MSSCKTDLPVDTEIIAAMSGYDLPTRMFSQRVTGLATMEQAVASHASRLGEKLRREGFGD